MGLRAKEIWGLGLSDITLTGNGQGSQILECALISGGMCPLRTAASPSRDPPPPPKARCVLRPLSLAFQSGEAKG